MSLKNSAYDTTACAGAVTDNIVDAARRLYFSNELPVDVVYEETPDVRIVRGTQLESQAIPSFVHPITFETREGHVSVVDVRPYGRLHDSFQLRDRWGYQSQLIRGQLQVRWMQEGGIAALRTFSQLPVAVYGNWVAEVISKRFALEHADQIKLAVAAAVFYQCQFSDPLTDNIDPVVLTTIVSKAVNLNHAMTLDLVQQIRRVDSLQEFCSVCYDITQNVRLKDLNPGILIQLVGGWWYGGLNARETMAVALEHPPTWCTLIWHAIADKGMTKSQLAQILQRNTYRRNADLYLKQFLGLIR